MPRSWMRDPPDPPRLTPGAVHLWRLDLDARPGPNGRAGLLSPDEQARARRLVHERRRARFISGRAALRTLLGRYIGVPPTEIRLAYGTRGKPSLSPGQQPATPIGFNLSHSGGRGLLAVTLAPTVGVDIEPRARRIAVDWLARRVLSAAEHEALLGLPPAEQRLAMLWVWTRKEAYVKALGGGISIPLGGFSVPTDPGPRTVRLDMAQGDGPPLSWWYHSFSPDPEHLATVAIPGEAPTPRLLDWPQA